LSHTETTLRIAAILRDSAVVTAALTQEVHGGSTSLLLEADSTLGYVQHQIDRLALIGEELPDETFIYEAQMDVHDLRSRAITALSNAPLYREERAAWVDDLDALSSRSFRIAIAVESAERQVKEEQRKVDEATRFKRKVARTGREKGLRAQLELLQQQWDEQKPPQLSEEEEEALKQRKRAVARGAWYNGEAAKMAEAQRFGAQLLAGEQPGITIYPVVLADYDLGRDAHDTLSEAGIQLERIFGSYHQIHNCRVLGIPVAMVPTSTRHARRVAQAILDQMQKSPEYGKLCRSFYLAYSPQRIKGTFAYFVLLPDTCKGEVTVRQWDFGSVGQRLKAVM